MYDYILKRAFENHKVITIMYQRGTDITQRNIKVLKINDSDIEAYCYLRHQVRHFKKDKILVAANI